MVNRYIVISIILIVFSILANIFLDYYIIPKRYVGIDQTQHFYDMKQWYKNGKFPTTSTRLIPTNVIDEEFTTPRVPGGAYYIFYTLFYKLSGENLFIAKIINCIFNLIIIFLFLFWFYKKFELTITSFIMPLILCNGYFVLAITDFWNPHLSLIFSFVLFILLFEYINQCQEDLDRKNIVRLSAIFIFPISAIIAQGHFFAFFSLIPTIIIYLIIRLKRTLKYIKYWVFGVFISFLEYLPYLISEINSNFSNLKMDITVKEGFRGIPFPQIHAIAIFPTNEMSFFYGSKFISIVRFWTEFYPFTIIGLLFLLITLAFSSICIIRGLYFIFNKKYLSKSNNEKILIEMLLLFFLFIPASIVFNFFSGQFSKIHYMYPFFALSYIPIILFFVQKIDFIKSKNKIIYLFSSFLFINIFITSLQVYSYINYYEKNLNEKELYNILRVLYDDSKGKDISIKLAYAGDSKYLYRDIARVYFTNININQIDNSEDIYVILPITGTFSKNLERVSNYLEYINNNTIELTNNSTLFLYKYIGTNAFMTP